MSKESALKMFAAKHESIAPTSLLTPDITAVADAIEADVIPEAKETTVEPPKVDDLQSSRMAIFAKKEAAIVKRDLELKAREEALKSKEAASDSLLGKGKQFDELWSKDKVAALRLLGATDSDLINLMAESSKEPTAEEIARKIAAEESQKIRDELKADKENSEKENNDRLVKGLKSDITNAIKADADKFEYCAFEGEKAEADAYQVIFDHLKESGEMMDVKTALEVVEELYESRDKAMSALKKRQPKVDAAAEAEVKKEPAKNSTVAERRADQRPTPAVPREEPIKKAITLNNEIRATGGGATLARVESAAQKRERLIEAIKANGLRK